MMSSEGEGSLPGEKQKPRGDNRGPNHYRKILRIAEMLTIEFHRIAQSLTHRAHEPRPAQRRREEKGGGFSLAATEIIRRIVPLPEAAYAAAVTFLSDTLDWLNPWHHDTASTGDLDGDVSHAEHNRLSSPVEP
jgi:hypothetical protein